MSEQRVLGGNRTPWWALALKWVLVAGALAFCGLMIQRAIELGAWLFVVVGAFIAMSVLVVYSTRRFVPAKYLVPGLIFMLFLQIYPIGYTVTTSFTNYNKSSNRESKAGAIAAIQSQSITQAKDSPTFRLSAAVPEGEDPQTGELTFLLSVPEKSIGAVELPRDNNVDAKGNAFFAVANKEVTALPAEGVRTGLGGAVAAAPSYRVLNLAELSLRLPDVPPGPIAELGDAGAILRGSATQAFLGRSSVTYDEATDTMTDANGVVYRPVEGSFVSDEGRRLGVGWTENVGFKNYERIFSDPIFRKGFTSIFIWNVAFAFLSVATTFLLGMMLALLFNDPRIRFKGLYRSILILPYAIPSFVTALVWGGMFNQDFGLINKVTNLQIDWLGDPWMAKVALLVTNLWLGFPYMFLICTGALQAIPSEVKEAAAVDGAGPFRTLRSVTMPLLLVAVGPLLVASFAFNFNNFGIVYLLTRGGPYQAENSSIGETDLLITFAYRLADEFNGGDIGLAAAISVVIFGIVGVMSAFGFARSKALEDVN